MGGHLPQIPFPNLVLAHGIEPCMWHMTSVVVQAGGTYRVSCVCKVERALERGARFPSCPRCGQIICWLLVSPPATDRPTLRPESQPATHT